MNRMQYRRGTSASLALCAARWLALPLAALLLAGGACSTAQAESIRVKDLGKIEGWRENALTGYGIVTGLAGTGDSPTSRVTHQALANALAQFNLTVAPDEVQSRNVAVVMVTAQLPPFARPGDTVDVAVTSAGDARSLLGGSLLSTALHGANGRVYALAQGALSVGGYRYDANGNVVQKNHPTVGAIPNGATVEVGVGASVLSGGDKLTFVLADPDYTTASRVASAINAQLGAGLAQARDAEGIDIAVPDDRRRQLVRFIANIESVAVEPDVRARVVINERTGTVVSGGDVPISKVAISQGDLKISVTTENTASQPFDVWRPGPGVRTAIVTNSRMDVTESGGPAYVAPHDTTVADLVHTLARLKISTRDMIAILQAVKAAGALHADLVIQ